MNVQVQILKDIPKKKIQSFEDNVVQAIARETLNATSGFFPRLTGELERGSYAFGVQGSNKKYGIGSEAKSPRGDYYAKYVWDYKQSTNWTNPNTLAQWYMTVFKNHKERIVNQAVQGAKRSL